MKVSQLLLIGSALAATACPLTLAARGVQESGQFLRRLQPCNGACESNDDCDGQLACMNGQCNDDPEMGTHICGGSGGGGDGPRPTQPSGSPEPSSSTCSPIGYLMGHDHGDCNTQNGAECCKDGESYPQYTCSPAVTTATNALLTLNGFGSGEEGGNIPNAQTFS